MPIIKTTNAAFDPKIYDEKVSKIEIRCKVISNLDKETSKYF